MTLDRPSRRQFLAGASALAVAGLTSTEALACRRHRACYCPGPNFLPPPPMLHVRQNVAALAEWQLASLRRGVAFMKQLPPTDPRSWRFQANIHGTTEATTNPLFNQCEHNSLLFLAWHRGYLYYFERILRWASGDPALALPYWDWTAARALPAPFRTPADPGNPLYDGTRHINDGSPLPVEVVVDNLNTALNFVPFVQGDHLGFSHSLENSPHGDVHDLINGNMGAVNTAANDPIFWLHHCNIDRVWDRWLSLGGGRADPQDPGWRGKTYSFSDESGRVVTHTVRELLDFARFAYRYDNVPNPPAAATPGEQPPVRIGDAPKLIRAASTLKEDQPQAADGKPLGFKPETVKLNLAERHAAALKSAAEGARPASSGRIVLQIEGLSAAESPDFVYAVYLNLPEDETSAEKVKLHYVETISFFGRTAADRQAHDHGEKRSTQAFDVTPVVARLREVGRWKPDALSVTLRPLTAVAPKGEEEQVRKRAAQSAERAKATYKSIHLLVAP
jgi:tyrosinase